MRHAELIPQSFLQQHVFDETTIKTDPSKALLDCNPHIISRKWRLIKKFEREMVCFDEARYLSDNFDDEVLEIVNALKDADQPLATYLAMLSMQGLNLEDEYVDSTNFTTSREQFHVNMAIVLDLSFAIFAEKRFLLFEDYNDQNSPVNIIKIS